MKILITGIHGFIGSNLVKHLSYTHEIYGVDITFPRKEGVIFTYNWTDLECNEIPDVDVIIHLAGKAHDIKNYAKAAEYFEINTGLTDKAFRYFMQSKAEKFIFFSSVKAIADQVDGDMLYENDTPAPVGPYAESKYAAEQNIRHAFDFKKPSEKSVYILRPCMIHGPGNKGNLNLLYQFVKKRIPWPLGAFENNRSFTSIDNLNFVIRQLVERDIPSGIYNMADDEPLSTNEVIRIIRETLHGTTGSQQSDGETQNSELRTQNKKLNIHHSLFTTRILNLPKPLIKTLALLGSMLRLPFNIDRLNKLTENYVVSNEKIKKALGVQSMPVTSREGLKRTVESFK